MVLEVLIFGAAALAAKADRVSIVVGGEGDSPTAGDVAAALGSQHPALGFALRSGRIAINQRYAAPDAPIAADDEVALIALLGGG